eukprot:gnl/MRDRNA2_/MRDRNA2_86017_c0_seq1.p1 gnl/MRDRNA2_/MRDRNA2_86017_c0~~gnl/MRDRNA2_/MRDRNA2_86017_c0_seq1.p1  ORF type:complete len:1154 (-),score=208.95 gnl/MRDRNA2_/MRDRNA2_86017_c0_seq1:34-3495(-)
MLSLGSTGNAILFGFVALIVALIDFSVCFRSQKESRVNIAYGPALETIDRSVIKRTRQIKGTQGSEEAEVRATDAVATAAATFESAPQTTKAQKNSGEAQKNSEETQDEQKIPEEAQKSAKTAQTKAGDTTILVDVEAHHATDDPSDLSDFGEYGIHNLADHDALHGVLNHGSSLEHVHSSAPHGLVSLSDVSDGILNRSMSAISGVLNRSMSSNSGFNPMAPWEVEYGWTVKLSCWGVCHAGMLKLQEDYNGGWPEAMAWGLKLEEINNAFGTVGFHRWYTVSEVRCDSQVYKFNKGHPKRAIVPGVIILQVSRIPADHADNHTRMRLVEAFNDKFIGFHVVSPEEWSFTQNSLPGLHPAFNIGTWHEDVSLLANALQTEDVRKEVSSWKSWGDTGNWQRVTSPCISVHELVSTTLWKKKYLPYELCGPHVSAAGLEDTIIQGLYRTRGQRGETSQLRVFLREPIKTKRASSMTRRELPQYIAYMERKYMALFHADAEWEYAWENGTFSENDGIQVSGFCLRHHHKSYWDYIHSLCPMLESRGRSCQRKMDLGHYKENLDFRDLSYPIFEQGLWKSLRNQNLNPIKLRKEHERYINKINDKYTLAQIVSIKEVRNLVEKAIKDENLEYKNPFSGRIQGPASRVVPRGWFENFAAGLAKVRENMPPKLLRVLKKFKLEPPRNDMPDALSKQPDMSLAELLYTIKDEVYPLNFSEWSEVKKKIWVDYYPEWVKAESSNSKYKPYAIKVEKCDARRLPHLMCSKPGAPEPVNPRPPRGPTLKFPADMLKEISEIHKYIAKMNCVIGTFGPECCDPTERKFCLRGKLGERLQVLQAVLGMPDDPDEQPLGPEWLTGIASRSFISEKTLKKLIQGKELTLQRPNHTGIKIRLSYADQEAIFDTITNSVSEFRKIRFMTSDKSGTEAAPQIKAGTLRSVARLGLIHGMSEAVTKDLMQDLPAHISLSQFCVLYTWSQEAGKDQYLQTKFKTWILYMLNSIGMLQKKDSSGTLEDFKAPGAIQETQRLFIKDGGLEKIFEFLEHDDSSEYDEWDVKKADRAIQKIRKKSKKKRKKKSKEKRKKKKRAMQEIEVDAEGWRSALPGPQIEVDAEGNMYFDKNIELLYEILNGLQQKRSEMGNFFKMETWATRRQEEMGTMV